MFDKQSPITAKVCSRASLNTQHGHKTEGQQKTAPVAEATVHTLDHRRLERRCLVMSLLWHLDGTV